MVEIYDEDKVIKVRKVTFDSETVTIRDEVVLVDGSTSPMPMDVDERISIEEPAV